jgi:hypothetical protein
MQDRQQRAFAAHAGLAALDIEMQEQRFAPTFRTREGLTDGGKRAIHHRVNIASQSARALDGFQVEACSSGLCSSCCVNSV